MSVSPLCERADRRTTRESTASAPPSGPMLAAWPFGHPPRPSAARRRPDDRALHDAAAASHAVSWPGLRIPSSAGTGSGLSAAGWSCRAERCAPSGDGALGGAELGSDVHARPGTAKTGETPADLRNRSAGDRDLSPGSRGLRTPERYASPRGKRPGGKRCASKYPGLNPAFVSQGSGARATAWRRSDSPLGTQGGPPNQRLFQRRWCLRGFLTRSDCGAVLTSEHTLAEPWGLLPRRVERLSRAVVQPCRLPDGTSLAPSGQGT
jgi:hypothetical protein